MKPEPEQAMNILESRVDAANQVVNALRDELHNGSPTPERATEIRELLADAKATQEREHNRYSKAWEGSFGPAVLTEIEEPGVGIVVQVIQGNALGGGRSHRIVPGDANYDAARAQVAAERMTDARVLAVALAAWGVDSVPCRIDYFGGSARVQEAYPGKRATPIPTGRKVTIDLATMTAR